MDPRPIGVLDSGLGGLTAVRNILTTLPDESLVYFGDTGRVPYGTRSPRIIEKYTRQDIDFLLSQKIKALIVACGTISSTALPVVRADYDIPIIGVVEPACRAAAHASKTGRVGVIGTGATIASGAYEARLRALLPHGVLTFSACPLFVPLVESGRMSKDDPVVSAIVSDYLAPIRAQEIDTLILGCTHYPILRASIAAFMGPGVTLIDVGAEAAAEAKRHLTEQDMLTDGLFDRHECYYFSDLTDDSAKWGSMVLGKDISRKTCHIEIEDY